MFLILSEELVSSHGERCHKQLRRVISGEPMSRDHGKVAFKSALPTPLGMRITST
jgi:hypothetical protein